MVGLHRTYLQPNGTKLDVANRRMTLGQVRGGAIRLGEASGKLIVCEGLEDGLTLHEGLGIPVWVACGAAFMRHMVIPATVRTLLIAADNDAAGESAPPRAADAPTNGGRALRLMRPNSAFNELNNQIQNIPQLNKPHKPTETTT